MGAFGLAVVLVMALLAILAPVIAPYSPIAQHPGQEVFKTVLPEDVDWKPFPAFPPSVRLSIVVGRPSEPGPTQSG